MRYTVIVGNIGQVADTTDNREAVRQYLSYVIDSRNNYGRAAGESVTLFCDDEIIREYVGTIQPEAD